MIYQPNLVLDLRLILGSGLFNAGLLAAIDFVAGTNKPWSYYAGAALGYTAAATSIPNAAATIYAVGESVDLALFNSPDGSDVRFFLNGVAVSAVDTFADSPNWSAVNIGALAAGIINRIDVVNNGVSANANATGVPWMAVGSVTVNGGYALRSSILAVNTLAVRIQDGEADTRQSTIPIYLPTGLTLAQVQTYADAILPEIDAITGGKITEATITFSLTLPAGLKATAADGVLNERGLLVSFDTTGNRADSVRIPAITTDYMSGDSVPLSQTALAALITRLTTTTLSVRPKTVDGFDFSAARRAVKSFRK